MPHGADHESAGQAKISGPAAYRFQCTPSHISHAHGQPPAHRPLKGFHRNGKYPPTRFTSKCTENTQCGCRQRNCASLAIFRICQERGTLLHIDVLPSKLQELPSAHSGLDCEKGHGFNERVSCALEPETKEALLITIDAPIAWRRALCASDDSAWILDMHAPFLAGDLDSMTYDCHLPIYRASLHRLQPAVAPRCQVHARYRGHPQRANWIPQHRIDLRRFDAGPFLCRGHLCEISAQHICKRRLLRSTRITPCASIHVSFHHARPLLRLAFGIESLGLTWETTTADYCLIRKLTSF